MSERVIITGIGVAVPGARTGAQVLAPGAFEPVDPAARVGKKGLRYKDRATQLALVAAYDALRAGALLIDPEDSKSHVNVQSSVVAVVAGSNYVSLDSVGDVVATIAANQGTRLVSPIVTPNLSSNIVASEVAIRYALRGPNLSVCNGATTGLDTLRWASAYLAAGRARHVLAVAAEPDNDLVRDLTGADRVVDGAVALLLERADVAAERGAPVLAELGGYTRTRDLAGVLRGLGTDGTALAGWYGPESPVDAGPLTGTTRFELADSWGLCSGVLGLLQCAAAVGRFQAGATAPILAVAGGSADDATAGVLLRAAS